MCHRKNKGVTLIELLIVVIILGVLAAIAIPRMSTSAYNAKKYACYTNVDILNTQLEMYAADGDGSYPDALSDLTADANYFPDGAPVCAFDSAAYPDSLTADDRVDATSHTH
jgi:prepilin-type N-terminal cleavage/methylation domain-containing protein